jgi:hypothetical protein
MQPNPEPLTTTDLKRRSIMAGNKLSPDEIERLRGLLAPYGVTIAACASSQEVIGLVPIDGGLWEALQNNDQHMNESDLRLVLKWMELAVRDMTLMINKLKESVKAGRVIA